MKSRRDHFILFRQQKNRWPMDPLRIVDAVQVAWNLQRHRPGEKPRIPPTELTQNHLPERRWIMQNQASNGTIYRDMKSRRCAEARAENDDRACTQRIT